MENKTAVCIKMPKIKHTTNNTKRTAGVGTGVGTGVGIGVGAGVGAGVGTGVEPLLPLPLLGAFGALADFVEAGVVGASVGTGVGTANAVGAETAAPPSKKSAMVAERRLVRSFMMSAGCAWQRIPNKKSERGSR